jgi:lipopolysaccharide O-acetyltransferase
MKVGKGFTTGHYCRIEAGNNRHDKHSPTLVIAAISKVIIGENVLIASDVFITDHDHGGIDYSSLSKAPAKRELVSSPVVIEDNVWLCEKVIILKGVRVGHNSIVAAGAVVTKDIPPFSIAVGIPARVTRLVHEEHDHFNETVS